MRAVFLGTPEFALPSLEALLVSSCEVCAVFTQPDRLAGRSQKPAIPAVKKLALAAGIPVFQPEKIRSLENQSILEAMQPDFVVVAAYGQILPPWLLRLPRWGCINVHASLLPCYRGAAPVARAILNGDVQTGVTTMLMDETLDTGPILLAKRVEISPTSTTGELTAVLARVGGGLLLPTLTGLCRGLLKPAAQDNRLATYAPLITKEQAVVDWHHSAASIHNQVRALNPWPLATTEFLGRRVQIIRSAPPDDSVSPEHHPGTFLEYTGAGIRVSCGRGSVLEILELQPAGKKRMTGRDFANGVRLMPGMQMCRTGLR